MRVFLGRSGFLTAPYYPSALVGGFSILLKPHAYSALIWIYRAFKVLHKETVSIVGYHSYKPDAVGKPHLPGMCTYFRFHYKKVVYLMPAQDRR